MKKILNIALKDLRVAFRDPTALLLMLATPFGLTLVIGFAFGSFSGGSSNSAGLQDIPVAIVNYDSGQLGANLIQVFQSDDLADLLAPVILQDDAAARRGVDADQYAAAVVVPAGFTDRIIPSGSSAAGTGLNELPAGATIQVYANPTRPVSVAIIRSIVDAFNSRVNAGAIAGRVAVEQLIRSGLVSPQEVGEMAVVVGEAAGSQAAGRSLISVDQQMSAAGQNPSSGFDWLSFTAPSMAVLFLMFTVTAGGRSILAERTDGTLARLLATPSTAAQVLGGKVCGIFLIGFAQVSILILASRLLLGVNWGAWQATLLLTLAVVAGATGWGALLAAYSRTPGQANATGTAMALIFGAAAGNFVPRQAMPALLRNASLISPNAWALEGYSKLTAGGGLADVLGPVIALLIMAAILFAVSLVAFRRQYS